MKKHRFLSRLISIFFTLGITLPAPAQITSDNTTNTIINQNGNNFDILNGIQKGNNLFHSFQEFSIPRGGSAIFNNSNDVLNIINRVTGGINLILVVRFLVVLLKVFYLRMDLTIAL